MRVAFLHGFLGDASVWDGIARAGDLRVALPGHGGGEVLPTWDANVDAIAARLGSVEAVVGYSLGARLALALVTRGVVARAIAISVNPGIADAEREVRRASDAAWAAMLREHGLPAFLERWENQPLFSTQARVSSDVLAARRARRLKHDPHQLARALEVLGLAEMPDYRDSLDDRTTLVVGADDDKFVAIARATRAAVRVIASCGHDPTLERPDELAALLDRERRT